MFARDRGTLRRVLAVSVAVLIGWFKSSGQIIQMRPVDISGGLKGGILRLSIVPFSADTLKPFDGNPFTEMAIQKSDTLILTLQSDSLFRLEKSKVFFWTEGQWTLEAATSLLDLDSRSGSYAMLVNSRSFASFQWDSAAFTQRAAKFVRLRGRNLRDSTMVLGEWTLEGSVRFTSLLLLPKPLKLVPGAIVQVQLKVLDDQKNVYPNFLTGPIIWRSSNPAVATVDEDGKVTGVSLGNTEISARTSDGLISGSTSVSVVQDFRPEKVKPMTVKVALVVQDPVIPSQGYSRIHELFNWRDPVTLANRLVFHFSEASDSVVNFQIVETVKDGTLFTRYYGNFMSAQQYYTLLKEPGWTSLRAAADSGKLWFDYREFVKSMHYDDKRNSGQIDEVWVFAGPYLGMYESQLLGPNAFWWNSPPIKDGTALSKLLSVMGLNYERGVDQAFHSFGHRVESAITQAYYQAQGRRWNPLSSTPSPWDLFTRIDKDLPGRAQVGNVHFPPNGVRDYDYGNTRIVKSYAENWYRYPTLFDQSSDVNVNTWIYKPGDPLAEGQDHIGFLRWWYGHLPRYVGVMDGVLNNWWHYALDYEAAVDLAKKTPVVQVSEESFGSIPISFSLEQNYPNPFNPATKIRFSTPTTAFVSLKIYDVLGREAATLVNGMVGPGNHIVVWSPQDRASGIYLCRLLSDSFVETRKMVLLH